MTCSCAEKCIIQNSTDVRAFTWLIYLTVLLTNSHETNETKESETVFVLITRLRLIEYKADNLYQIFLMCYFLRKLGTVR